MSGNRESGKIRPLVAVILAGVVLVCGTLIAMFSSSGPEKLESDLSGTEGYEEPVVVAEIADPALNPIMRPLVEEENEEPIVTKTVNMQGDIVFIKNEPEKVFLPGKGFKKMTMTATATNHVGVKIKEAAKSKKMAVHPGIRGVKSDTGSVTQFGGNNDSNKNSADDKSVLKGDDTGKGGDKKEKGAESGGSGK